MIPLTIEEAELVAKQIRESTRVDPKYWPWVIEELCKEVRRLRAEEDRLDALVGTMMKEI